MGEKFEGELKQSDLFKATIVETYEQTNLMYHIEYTVLDVVISYEKEISPEKSKNHRNPSNEQQKKKTYFFLGQLKDLSISEKNENGELREPNRNEIESYEWVDLERAREIWSAAYIGSHPDDDARIFTKILKKIEKGIKTNFNKILSRNPELISKGNEKLLLFS